MDIGMRWAMQDVMREFAIKKEAERLGVPVEDVRARVEAKEQARLDAWLEEGRQRLAIWEPKQDAAQLRLGEHVGLSVPVGISRARRRDSHRHLVALGTCVIGKNTRQEGEALCNGYTHFPGLLDLADAEDSPTEWLSNDVTCPRCRRIAAKKDLG